jgi:hypothetical protein
VNPYPGSLTTAGYQCVEFSRRYLFYKYGATYNWSTNGDQVVDHYGHAFPTFFTIINNGTVGRAPVAGDVISFSPVPTFNDPAGGHTVVVQASAVNSSGNGALTIVEENSSSTGVRSIPVTSWRIAYGSFVYAKWLHATGKGKVSGAPLPPPPPPSPPNPLANGNFVSYGGHAYRIAGGAPVYVSSWAVFGGVQPTFALTARQWASLPARPANGTLVTGVQTHQVYVIAGGAPVYVRTWPGIGGGRPTVSVDQAALDSAGGAAQWSHLAARPVDGTLVKGLATGQVYRFAGGAPLYLPPTSLPARAAVTVVDQQALDNGGGPAQWSHVLYRPADGTFLTDGTSAYRVAGGTALTISSCAALGGCSAAATVDRADIARAGGTGAWSHLLATLPNGTMVRVANGPSSGRFSRAVGGALLTVPSCAAAVLNGCHGAVLVDQGAVSTYGVRHPGVSNGTYVQVVDGADSGQVSVAAGGALLDLSQCSAAVLNGCPGKVPVDAASFTAYADAHPIPVPGTTVRALDSRVSWAFASTCRAVTAAASSAVGVLSSAIAEYPSCIAISTGAVPNGLAGVAYRTVLAAKGGSSQYRFAVTSGRLPAGLSLAPATGVLGGTALQSGTFGFTVTATDVLHPAVTAARAFRVTIAPMTIRQAPDLPVARYRVGFRLALSYSGGAGAHTFRLLAGHLPAGMGVSAKGVIWGAPTQRGTFHAAIELTDSSHPALRTMKVFALTVR